MPEISNVLNGVKTRLVSPLKSSIVVAVIMIMNHHSWFLVNRNQNFYTTANDDGEHPLYPTISTTVLLQAFSNLLNAVYRY